ncbi:MAG: hypothetical protein J0M04_02015 [Verrucomicrobia bacterium]|nr:hypothetical protein [Verrucomicrobiota bacterium]
MTLTDRRFKQPTMISLILAMFVSLGLGAVPNGGEVERKGGSSGKMSLTQVAKDFQNPGRPVLSDDEVTTFSGGIHLLPTACGCYVCVSAGRELPPTRFVDKAVRGRAPPVFWQS